MGDYRGHIKAIALELLGSPNKGLSSPGEWRYGSHGSLSVDIEKGCWFDHEHNEGGGPVELVRRQTGAVNGEAERWLQERFGTMQGKREIAAYDYRNEYGQTVFQVVRYDPKDFRQRRPDGAGGWLWNMRGIKQVPYRLPDIIARQDEPIFIVEGEKDADRLHEAGYLGTTNAAGANKWNDTLNRHFRGRDVFIVPDNDEAGRTHANAVARKLSKLALSVRICPLPADAGLPEKADISDWIDHQGGDAGDLRLTCRAYEPFEGKTRAYRMDGVMVLRNLIGKEPPERQWLWAEMMPFEDVTMVGGHGGEGKSLLMLQLAICSAAGVPFLGVQTRRTRPLFVSCEDDHDEIWRRVMAVCTGLNIPVTDIQDALLPVARRGMENLLTRRTFNQTDRTWDTEITNFYGDLRSLAQEHGAGCIILDSLYNFFGGNENDRSESSYFIGLLRQMAQEAKSAIVLISHPSRAGMETSSGDSGSTAWHNAVRARFYMRRDPDDKEVRILENKKPQYGPPSEPIRLVWQDWTFVRDDLEEGILGGIKRRTAENIFLELLDRLEADGIRVSPKHQSGNYAPRLMARMPGHNLSQDQFRAVMDRLYRANEVKTAVVLNASRHEVEVIVRVEKGGLRDEN